jgi:hypothetical protein
MMRILKRTFLLAAIGLVVGATGELSTVSAAQQNHKPKASKSTDLHEAAAEEAAASEAKQHPKPKTARAARANEPAEAPSDESAEGGAGKGSGKSAKSDAKGGGLLAEVESTLKRLDKEVETLEDYQKTLEVALDNKVVMVMVQGRLMPVEKDVFKEAITRAIAMGRMSDDEASQFAVRYADFALQQNRLIKRAALKELNLVKARLEKKKGEVSYFLNERVRLKEK